MEEEVQKLIDIAGYWAEHPDYSVDDWQYEVANGDTRQGYWWWVAAQLGVIEL